MIVNNELEGVWIKQVRWDGTEWIQVAQDIVKLQTHPYLRGSYVPDCPQWVEFCTSRIYAYV